MLAAWAGAILATGTKRGRLARIAASFMLLALSLVVLTRGAPHNNPLIYAVFDKGGALGLVAVALALLGGALGVGVALSGRPLAARLGRFLERDENRLVLGLAALAPLAAAEQVVRYWNVSGWGDAMFWDRIAHLIARGEMPAGHSYYMPVYQYGTAALYWLFGHHYAVLQVANVLLAPLTVIFTALTARNLGAGPRGVLLVALLTATHDYLRYTAHVMQIENWYIPFLSLALWASTRSAVKGDLRSAALGGLMIGLTLSTRAQGAFLCAALLLAPLVLGSGSWPRRFRQFMVMCVVFVAVLAPWTARNWAIDGRFSPLSSQGPAHMVMALEPQAFFGIRRDLVGPEFWKSWTDRYPDPADRERAMAREIVAKNLADPMRFIEGAAWRSLAFYGLLPDGVFAPGGPQPTDWAATGKTWLLRNLATLGTLAAAVIGLLLLRGWRGAFPLAAIAGSMVPVLLVGFTEARIHYPTLPLLFLLPAVAIAGRSPAVVRAPTKPMPRRAIAFAILALVAGLGSVASTIDRRLIQPIREADLHIVENAMPSSDMPDLTRDFLANTIENRTHAPAGLADGLRLRLRISPSNQHLPVRWYADEVRDFPAFSLDPARPPFFRASVVNDDFTYDWGASPVVAVGFGGATLDRIPLEDDVIEIEGQLVTRAPSGLAFIEVDIGRIVGHSRPAGRPLSAQEEAGDQ